VSNHAKGLLIVGAGVVAISPDALIVRLVHMEPLAIAFWRALLMGIGFVGLALILYRRRTVRRFRSMGRVGLAAACFSGVSGILFVTSITHTAVANTLVILAASPMFAAVLSAIFLGDRISSVTWGACALILVGVAIIVHGSLDTSSLLGDLAALGASLSTSGMLVVLRHHPGADPVPGVALGGFLAALAVSPGVDGFAPSAHDLALLMVLGLLLLPIAIGLIMRGPAYLTAPEVGLMTLLETILGPLWVWIVIGDQPSGSSLLSGALIVSVLAVHAILALRAEGRVARQAAAAHAEVAR
jgi:drug/metabolite transporter (DMT)-like permease